MPYRMLTLFPLRIFASTHSHTTSEYPPCTASSSSSSLAYSGPYPAGYHFEGYADYSVSNASEPSMLMSMAEPNMAYGSNPSSPSPSPQYSYASTPEECPTFSMWMIMRNSSAEAFRLK
ncbi:hypothetical protein D9758_002880 [Tetrapyrgos nigripes]|uniref:Uncharacterized protein n=1 Tax=Tetrapyrgos nigripes TaxID=182062 RepID=A0A8H5GQ80_9AGAR|nr:hypothetical protein D9758_002880 [Tetrapyrgos nigripes]